MPFRLQDLQIAVPQPEISLCAYATNDKPDEIEQPEYFAHVGIDGRVQRLDLVTIIAEKDAKRPSVAQFIVNSVDRKGAKLARYTPWAQAGAAPGVHIPSDEDALVDSVAKAIAKMSKRDFTHDDRPNRSVLAGRLGWMPSPEIVDLAMSVLEGLKRDSIEKENIEREAQAEVPAPPTSDSAVGF